MSVYDSETGSHRSKFKYDSLNQPSVDAVDAEPHIRGARELRKHGHPAQVNASMDHMRLRHPALANTALVNASMDSMPVKGAD